MERKTSERPWEGLEPGVARVLAPELPSLADEIVAAVSAGVPDYARPLEGPFGRGLRAGVEKALSQFVRMIERPGDDREGGRELYVNLGRGEMLAGRTLDALLAAYRLGARVAWRRFASVGAAAGLPPETLYLLAESIFAYIDELSAESVEGYAQEQSAAAGEAQRRRQLLVRLLVQDPPADRAATATAAAEAGWELPGELAAVTFYGEDPDRQASRMGAGAIATRVGDLCCAVVPDPDAPGRRAQLARALDGCDAALGPTVPWPEAPQSFRRAAATTRLVADGVIRDSPLVSASDHSVTLLLYSDRGLAAQLVRQRLRPLDGLAGGARARLVETLRAWLDHQGRPGPIAEALHVHPQTVRYRLARIRELFGDSLDDPDARLELDLALRADALGQPRT